MSHRSTHALTNSRRHFLQALAGTAGLVALPGLSALPTMGAQPVLGATAAKKRIAGIITIYRRDSHADVILGKILEGWQQDGGDGPQLELVSLYVDQFPEDDLSRDLAKRFGFKMCQSIPEALTLGGDSLAVDGVISVGEHGDYPYNDKGQHLYPRRRFFEGILSTFEKCGQVVPVFNDKHPGPQLEDMLWMAEQTRKLRVPWMAGSSLPVGYHDPEVTLPWGDRMQACAAVGYSGLDVYGFHTLDVMQSVIERRAGEDGRTPYERGVQSVQCLPLTKLADLIADGTIDAQVLDAALSSSKTSRQAVLESQEGKDSAIFIVKYRDGLVAPAVMLGNQGRAISMAYRTSAGQVESFRAEERVEPRYPHFAKLLKAIEQMMLTGQPTYPVERTLLSSGTLDRLLTSRAAGGTELETPQLAIQYAPAS